MPDNAPTLFLGIAVVEIDDAGSIERAYEAGATDFVAKPFQWPLFTQRVRYALRAAATARASREVAASLTRAQQMAQLGGWSLGLDGSLQCSGELLRMLGLPLHGGAAGVCAGCLQGGRLAVSPCPVPGQALTVDNRRRRLGPSRRGTGIRGGGAPRPPARARGTTASSSIGSNSVTEAR